MIKINVIIIIALNVYQIVAQIDLNSKQLKESIQETNVNYDVKYIKGEKFLDRIRRESKDSAKQVHDKRIKELDELIKYEIEEANLAANEINNDMKNITLEYETKELYKRRPFDPILFFSIAGVLFALALLAVIYAYRQKLYERYRHHSPSYTYMNFVNGSFSEKLTRVRNT